MVVVRVPHLYKLEIGVPLRVDTQATRSYFDCKLRKLFIVLSQPSAEDQEELKDNSDEDIDSGA